MPAPHTRHACEEWRPWYRVNTPTRISHLLRSFDVSLNYITE